MLNLKSSTTERWLAQVDADLEAVLVDHAHCEKKAAGTAMNLMFAYPGRAELCRELADIVVEELDHFRQVLDLLASRAIPFSHAAGEQLRPATQRPGPQAGSASGGRSPAGGRADRGAFCERFALLGDHVPDRELAEFYRSLFESRPGITARTCGWPDPSRPTTWLALGWKSWRPKRRRSSSGRSPAPDAQLARMMHPVCERRLVIADCFKLMRRVGDHQSPPIWRFGGNRPNAQVPCNLR